VLQNVGGTATANAVTFQAINPNATATVGTVAAASNVIALNGAYTNGTAAGVIAALGTSADAGITTTAAGKFLLVTYSVGNIAQVWSFDGDSTLDTNITEAELDLVATLNGVALNGLTAANFSTYLTPVAATTTVSNAGQTITLTGTSNTVQSTANAAGQFLTAAADTINVGVGTLPTSSTVGLTIIDPATGDADVMNATVLGDWAAGSVVSGIETINLNMLVAGTTFSAAAKTPGTSQFGLTGTQNFTATALPAAGGLTLGSGYTGLATFGVISDTGSADSIVVNLAGNTATSATVGSAINYIELNADSMETATVNVSATSSIRMFGADLFAPASDITATNLAGSGNLTVFGTATALGTLNLNASGVGYTGNLTLRPTTNAAMDFSTATGGAGLVTGIKTIDLQDVATGTWASAITLDSANSTTNAAVTVSYAPTAAGTLGIWTISQEGSGLSDAVTLSLGANASASGNITATSIETFTVNSSRASTGTLTLGNITLTDGAGSQTITVTSASTVGAGTLTADTVNFAGVTGTVSGVTLANTAGASFTGGSGATTVAGSANADVINTGIGNDTITGLAGNDIINAGDGTNSITGGAGTDTLTGGSGVDTYVMVAADIGDTITNFTVATDVIDWNTALVSITVGNTTPLFYQAAAAGTAIAVTTTVFELTGVTGASGAAGLVTALGATATNTDTDANILIVYYITGGGAEIYNWINTDADVEATELTLVATLVGVAADAVTTANFI